MYKSTGAILFLYMSHILSMVLAIYWQYSKFLRGYFQISINFKYTELLNINPRGLIVKKYSFVLILKSCGLIVKSRGLL